MGKRYSIVARRSAESVADHAAKLSLTVSEELVQLTEKYGNSA